MCSRNIITRLNRDLPGPSLNSVTRLPSCTFNAYSKRASVFCVHFWFHLVMDSCSSVHHYAHTRCVDQRLNTFISNNNRTQKMSQINYLRLVHL